MEKTVALSEEELGLKDALNNYISAHALPIQTIENISRFPGGYSNLTYCLSTKAKEYVLRTPPHGANIKSAHDMGREFKVLSLLKPHFAQVPTPIDFCEDVSILGAPFYIMEKLEGTILRAYNAPKMQLPASTFTLLSEQLIDTLVALHSIDIASTHLDQLGKPDGYVQRQVEGWIKRYYAAETDTIESMNQVAKWLQSFRPIEQAPAFLHNDFKYDNVIFSNDFTKVIGVLDWEMSTVGDPLMDLGAMLAYWFEAGEGEIFKQYNLSWLPGNYTRKQLIDRYASKTGRDLSDIHFYFVFGLFKNAVIAQQIYHRYKQGHSSDERFGALLPMIQLLGAKALVEIKN
ncbi:MAG: phosphotransferase family protein [Sphingobacteriia bacterium]|nr:MAG: phosphotransferase family protein [Sphingobacteriia bacterium]